VKIKDIIIIVLGVIIVFLFTCKGEPKPVKTITKTVTRVDSVRVIDTLERIVRVPIKEVPLIEPKGMDLSDTNEFNEGLRTFHYGASDSLLKYNIYVKSDIKPLSVQMEYDLKQFTIHDSIYIRDSIHVKEEIKKSFLSVGGQVIAGGGYFGVAPMLVYSHKKGNNFGLGYDVINNNLQVQFTKRISFK